jgi:hypothetical protein
MTDTDPLREAPIAWIVLCTDADQIRIWWRDEERAKAWAARHDRPLIPLYAKPFVAADFLALPTAAPLREAQSDLTRAELGAAALRRQPARIGNESNHEYLVRLARAVINASSAVENVVLPFSPAKPVRQAKDLLTEFQAYWGEPPLDDQQFEMLEGMISEALASALPPAPSIESECCREDTLAWEPCPAFQDLQKEKGDLRSAVIEECAEASENIAKRFRFSYGADTTSSSAVNLATAAIRALANAKGDGK